MPRFSYTAYDHLGARTAGEISADTRELALEALSRQGRFPLELVEGGAVAAPRWWEREVFAPGQLSRRNLALLTRELATLVKAELPVDEALRIVSLQPLMGTRARGVVAAVLARVLDGASLSEALQGQKQALPEFYWRIIHAGETSGTLGQALDELATFLERSAEFRAKVASALVYPVTLLIAAVAALAVILMILVPTIAPMFKDAGRDPPAVIQVLIGIEEFIAGHWLLVLLALAALIAGAIVISRNEQWRVARDRAFMRVPLLSGLIENGETAVLARTLGTMVKNGVPLLQALEVTGDSLSNRAMAGAVHACAAQMREGGTLVGSLVRAGVFPELSLRLIAVGEQSGQLETMLARVAEIYEAALQRQLQRITSLLTPILTVCIGLVVGGLLLSVMGAIVSVNDLALQ
jgi:general secretion pathway protein F